MLMIFYMLFTWFIKFKMGDFDSNIEMLIFLIKGCIPFASRINWFYSCYMVLYVLSPFINEVCEKFNKELFIKMLLTAGFIFYVLPTMFYFEITQDGGKGVVNVILVYCIGRAIALYYDQVKMPKKWFFILVTIAHFTLNLIIFEVTGGSHNIFSRDNNVLVISASIWLFYYFKSKSFTRKYINAAATYVFPILIFHNAIMKIVMTKLVPQFSVLKYQYSNLLGVYICFYILILVLGIGIIEFIRRRLFYKFEDIVAGIIEKLFNKANYLYILARNIYENKRTER